MTNYREILRLSALGLSQSDIARSCNASKRTVNSVLKAAKRENISWPLDNDQTNAVLAGQLYPSEERSETLQKKRMPNFSHIRKELLRNGSVQLSHILRRNAILCSLRTYQAQSRCAGNRQND